MQENFDKTHRIDILTDKVQKLLAKNERYIDDSSRIIEQRNDAMRQSSDQTRQQMQELHMEKAKADNALGVCKHACCGVLGLTLRVCVCSGGDG